MRRLGFVIAIALAFVSCGPAPSASDATPSPPRPSPSTTSATSTGATASTTPTSAPTADGLLAKGLIVVNPQGGSDGPQPYLRTERDPTPLAEFSSGYYRQLNGTASPDGTKIAYWSYPSSAALPMALRILDTGRPNTPRTMLTLANERGERPLWSSDGNALLIPVTDANSGQGVVAEYCALRTVDLVTGGVREVARVERAWLIPTSFDRGTSVARAYEQDYSTAAVLATWEMSGSSQPKRTAVRPGTLAPQYSMDGSLTLSVSGTEPSPLTMSVSETRDPQRTYALPADPLRPIWKGWGFRPNSDEVYVWRMNANSLQLALWEPRSGRLRTVDVPDLGMFRADGSAVVTNTGLVVEIATGARSQIPGLPPAAFIGALARLP